MNANNLVSCIPYTVIVHAHRLIVTGGQKSVVLLMLKAQLHTFCTQACPW